ncbi:hypothetical protein Bhyg_10449 [Pseudolycoriella hygida]|uniref:Uncharacterized protein n=1 Tax=Pseudolycoriella hygida TaxID=35572 RepID=A0A9Q0MTI5_9DIPT|nr:hypothetical protein Bhyg_10449 [Pseudolycoriella hygida]
MSIDFEDMNNKNQKIVLFYKLETNHVHNVMGYRQLMITQFETNGHDLSEELNVFMATKFINEKCRRYYDLKYSYCLNRIGGKSYYQRNDGIGAFFVKKNQEKQTKAN